MRRALGLDSGTHAARLDGPATMLFRGCALRDARQLGLMVSKGTAELVNRKVLNNAGGGARLADSRQLKCNGTTFKQNGPNGLELEKGLALISQCRIEGHAKQGIAVHADAVLSADRTGFVDDVAGLAGSPQRRAVSRSIHPRRKPPPPRSSSSRT